ncbi:hypothetical protein Vafri_8551, partial [Volvox africanus]
MTHPSLRAQLSSTYLGLTERGHMAASSCSNSRPAPNRLSEKLAKGVKGSCGAAIPPGHATAVDAISAASVAAAEAAAAPAVSAASCSLALAQASTAFSTSTYAREPRCELGACG